MRSQMNTNSRYADTFSDSTGGIHNRTTHDTLSLNKPLGAPIRNEIGEQNCYVNVIIHTIFNIKEMREYFLTEEIENEDRLSILFEMKMIIEKYHDLVSIACKTPETFKFIDPIDFRRELDNLFREEKKFRMKSMGDPVDLFFVILNSFHSYRSSSLKYIHETPCNPPCLAHSLFWINLLEQNECERCGATSEVLQYDYNYFIYEVYVKELLNKLEGRDDMSRNLVKLIKEVNVRVLFYT